MDNVPLDKNFANFPWDQKIKAAQGFFRFTDGGLQCVMMKNSVRMRVLNRTSSEFFSTFVTREHKNSLSSNELGVIINGSFGENWTAVIIAHKLALDHLFVVLPTDAGDQEILGEVVKDRALVPPIVVRSPATRPKRAFLAFDLPNKPSTYQFGIGDPPHDALAALGGLGPILIGGAKNDSALSKAGGPLGGKTIDNFYSLQSARGQGEGQMIVAQSKKPGLSEFFLIVVQPQMIGKGFTLDQLRDRLADAGMDDAVFMDGGDSVMLMHRGNFDIKQGVFKNEVTTIGLGFFYTTTP